MKTIFKNKNEEILLVDDRKVEIITGDFVLVNKIQMECVGVLYGKSKETGDIYREVYVQDLNEI